MGDNWPDPVRKTAAPSAAPRTYYSSVQGLRGFSALSVFCLHLYLMASHGGFFPNISHSIESAWSTLGHGVAIFFIISGFVIPASLVRHGDLRRFIIDRLLRIMPLFTAIHLLVFVVGPFIGYKWLRSIGILQYAELFVTNLTFTALPLSLPLAQQNSWTLSYEWAFYVLVGALWLARKRRLGRFTLLPFVVLLASVICFYLPVCLFFVVGMLFSVYIPKLQIQFLTELILIPSCLALFYYLAQFVSLGLATLPAIPIFWATCQEGTATSRLLSRPLPQFFGKISYSLYLVHPVAIFPFQLLAQTLMQKHYPLGAVFAGYLVLAVVATVTASMLSHHWIEIRARDSLLSWFGTSRAGHAHPIEVAGGIRTGR